MVLQKIACAVCGNSIPEGMDCVRKRCVACEGHYHVHMQCFTGPTGDNGFCLEHRHLGEARAVASK